MRGLIVPALLLVAGAAEARSFAGCTEAEEKVAGAALDGAAGLATRAAAAVGDTAAFGRWFGPWSPAADERVRATLKAVHGELRADALRVDCEARDRTCLVAYAFVERARPGIVNLCPRFFRMPSLAEAAGGASIETGTREGVLIHELSHFPAAGDTGDACTSRTDCRSLARADPGLAVGTADSFQYFAEDMTLGAP